MNQVERLDAILKEMDLFSSLDQPSLDLLKEKMKFVSLEPGECLCSEGDPGDRMYVVVSGEIRVLKSGKTGNTVEITCLRTGETAGIMSLFEEEPRSATLQASGKVQLWEIDKKTFQHLLNTQPSITQSLLTALSRYLRRETKIVAELSSHDADHRLRVAVFDSKPDFERILTENNQDRYALSFIDSRLNQDTVARAAGFRGVRNPRQLRQRRQHRRFQEGCRLHDRSGAGVEPNCLSRRPTANSRELFETKGTVFMKLKGCPRKLVGNSVFFYVFAQLPVKA